MHKLIIVSLFLLISKSVFADAKAALNENKNYPTPPAFYPNIWGYKPPLGSQLSGIRGSEDELVIGVFNSKKPSITYQSLWTGKKYSAEEYQKLNDINLRSDLSEFYLKPKITVNDNIKIQSHDSSGANCSTPFGYGVTVTNTSTGDRDRYHYIWKNNGEIKKTGGEYCEPGIYIPYVEGLMFNFLKLKDGTILAISARAILRITKDMTTKSDFLGKQLKIIQVDKNNNQSYLAKELGCEVLNSQKIQIFNTQQLIDCVAKKLF